MQTAVIVYGVSGLEGFDPSVAALGALLILGALVSGLARRSFVSLAALFVLAGFLLGRGGLGVLSFEPESGFVQALALVALIVILFRDGLEVDAEMLQTAWRLPLRKLVLAMPLTAALVALAAKALTDLSWPEAFLIGALLSPTDPVLSSSVVTNPRVPRVIRHSLNLESGMNDGLALPAVLAFSAALSAAGAEFVWWRFVLQDITLGFVTGALVGFLAARLLPAGATAEREARLDLHRSRARRARTHLPRPGWLDGPREQLHAAALGFAVAAARRREQPSAPLLAGQRENARNRCSVEIGSFASVTRPAPLPTGCRRRT